MRRWILVALVAGLAAAGCGAGGGGGPGVASLDRGAALATLRVENRTPRTLAIRFRYASSPDRTVEVGRLEPRILDLDETLTWIIADTTAHER